MAANAAFNAEAASDAAVRLRALLDASMAIPKRLSRAYAMRSAARSIPRY